jgi:hypothetical protein
MRSTSGTDTIYGTNPGTSGVATESNAVVTISREAQGVFRLYFPPNFTLKTCVAVINGVAPGMVGVDQVTARSCRVNGYLINPNGPSDLGHRFTATGVWTR